MLDWARIAEEGWPEPPPVAPGDHGLAAEHYRQEALGQIRLMKFYGEMLELFVRQYPDEDDGFDTWAEKVLPNIRAIGLAIHSFRHLRDAKGQG